MSLIADGILIVTCLTTAIYCYVLSRRLARLSDTDDGIGKQISQLNAALEETRTGLKEIRSTTKSASDKLGREVAQARKISRELAKLIEGARAASAGVASKAPASEPDDRYADAAADDPEDDPAPEPPELREAEDGSTPEDEEVDLSVEQQLGFLPDIDDASETQEEDLTQDVANDGEDLPDGGEGEDFDDLPPPGATDGQDGELLKIERMAV